MCEKNEENYITSSSNTKMEGKEADFETAISKTNFGFFNLILLLVTIPSIFASQFEISALSFAFPAAQCDLDLTLEDRGLINAIIYIGMIGSCFMWGPLVDIFGRRKILIISHLLDSIFVFLAAFSPNLGVLVGTKFMGGFIINGPSMALTPYLSEFHGTHYRSRVPLTIGLLYSVANICLPLLAWAILPLNIQISVFGGFEIHSWNIFLLICTIPSFTSGMFFLTMPESPKYLMSKGNNDEALNVFQKIFRLNTRKPKEEYPVKKLIDDKQIYNKNHSVGEAWKQISPLFSVKYLTKLVLVCILMMSMMMCINSLRLWLPDIFQAVNDYHFDNDGTPSFCHIINTMYAVDKNGNETCFVNFENSSVYINSTIVGGTAVVGYLVAGLGVNKIGKKRMLIILGIISGVTEAAVYFSPNSLVAIILICIHLMCACVCIDTVVIFTVDLFPTYLRASALSLTLMCGRIGSVIGNLLFPVLLQAGCAAPFFTLGSIMILCTTLSVFLPNTDLKALE